jgi:CheY-like chemotaxis protein
MNGVPTDRMHVLIVEDNQHFRTLVRSILEALGVSEIEEARDGAEAVEMLGSFPADLAVLDWKMDGVDGIECVRRIRKGEGGVNRFLPIIMLTGYTEDSLMAEAVQAGVNGFLGKPVSAKSLYSRILSVMQGSQVYIETADYFGPDRRRNGGVYKGDERRKAQTNVLTHVPFQD